MTLIHALTFTNPFVIMFLGAMNNPENVEETHTNMSRTWNKSNKNSGSNYGLWNSYLTNFSSKNYCPTK